MQTFELATILGAPIAAAVVLATLRGRARRYAGWIAGLAALLSTISILLLLPALQRGETPVLSIPWIPTAGIGFGLRLDWLALPFVVTEAGVTLVAVLYSWGYHHVDERSHTYYALLMLFAAGMAGTTLADSMFLFYIFWELMLVASCVLIALWGEGERIGAVALKYFLFTHFGSILVLSALVLLYGQAGTDSFSVLRAGVSLSPALTSTLIVLFIVGFCVKMAVFPLHLWLPDAHTVAPMSVTIMLAAAMLSMGTYGIVRFPFSAFTLDQVAPFGLPMMIGGLVSAIYGALMSLAEQDVKRIIAYSSVSQMGYVLFGLGTLTADGIVGATLHVIFHAIVKALLFMCVGLVVRATGRRSIGELGGLGRTMRLGAFCTGVGVLAIAGVPPLALFDSEWMIFAGGFETAHVWVGGLMVLASLLTVAYALWFWMRIFFGAGEKGLRPNPVPMTMIVPTVGLAALALIEGVLPGPLFGWAQHELSLLLGGIW
jgi:NADH-quinone oxidoreductase subunit M